MDIRKEQLAVEDGKIMYTSLDYGMEELNLPSADSVTLHGLWLEKKGWGQPAVSMTGRREVDHKVNVAQIEKDLGKDYPDQRGIQYLRYGGVANVHIELKSDIVKENHKMSEDGRNKARRNIKKDVGAGNVEIRNEKYNWIREHDIGAIAKSRKDRKKLSEGLPCAWRVIDDMSGSGALEGSVNEATGSHGSLALAQGDRIAEACRRTVETAKRKGRDPSKIVGLKVDIASAYRNFKVTFSDRWLFGFMFEGVHYIHTSWPFGSVASVYNFLRVPLMIVFYLGVISWWWEAGIVAAMYFDDLSVIGHRDDMPRAGQEVLDLFNRWGIPRQHEKWDEENPNGVEGSSELTIMGLRYSFATMTVGIPATRLRDILDEVQSFREVASQKAQSYKKWESVVGVLGWCSIAIPQLRPLLTGTWYFKRVWENQYKKKGVRRMSKDIQEDWARFVELAKEWNGTSSIYQKRLPPVNPRGYDNHHIAPAADASGSIGWGIVSEYGYAKANWTKKERELEIHLKEGLALYMLIALTGSKLKRHELNRTFRSDNDSLVKSLKRGRAKNRKLNIVVQLIIEELLRHDMVLRCWRTRRKTEANIEHIGTKENILADALSRDDMETYETITNKLPFNARQELEIPIRITERWTRAVDEMTSIS